MIDETEEGYINDVSFDIRPGHVGGEYPLKGDFRLRSFNSILNFLGRSIEEDPEYHVDQDPRTPAVQENPVRTMDLVTIGWSALGSRPVDSVPRKILRCEHHGTAGTLEPRGLPNAVSLVPNDRQRGTSRRSPQHHHCEVTGPQPPATAAQTRAHGSPRHYARTPHRRHPNLRPHHYAEQQWSYPKKTVASKTSAQRISAMLDCKTPYLSPILPLIL